MIGQIAWITGSMWQPAKARRSDRENLDHYRRRGLYFARSNG